MQDNDLPQIGTPMQTDETRAQIGRHLATFNLFREADHSLQITIAEAKGVQAELGGSGAPLALCAMNALYSAVDSRRGKSAFASPPAVEREGAMLRICRSALLKIRDWQGEQNPAGNTYRTPIGFKGSPFDYLRKLANDALRESARVAWGVDTPTLHPSDREAIAEALWNVGERDRYNMSWERAKAENHNWVVGCYMHTDAILALSGSLAPANPTEKGEL